jgi:hypothetical protein
MDPQGDRHEFCFVTRLRPAALTTTPQATPEEALDQLRLGEEEFPSQKAVIPPVESQPKNTVDALLAVAQAAEV